METQLKLITPEINKEDPENFILFDRINDPIPEPEMIFPNLWPARTIALFTGDGGVGKTHLTLQLLKAIASGMEICGTPFLCEKPRPVVFFSQEDEGEFLRAEFLNQFPELKEQPEIARRVRIVST